MWIHITTIQHGRIHDPRLPTGQGNNDQPTAPARALVWVLKSLRTLQCKASILTPDPASTNPYTSPFLIVLRVLRCSQLNFETFSTCRKMTPSDKTRSRTFGDQRRNRQPKPDIHRTSVQQEPRRSPLPLMRKALVAGVVALAVGSILCWKGSQNGLGYYTSRAVDWNDRREEVKEAFVVSWDAYSEHAWGSLLNIFLVMPACPVCSVGVLNIAGEIRPRSVPPTFEERLANEPRWLRMDHR